MKIVVFIGAAAGITLLLWLALQADLPAMLRALRSGGWALLWLIPYRTLFYALYAWGWWILLHSAQFNPPAGFGYVLWVTSVREAMDRLMPVASVGGSLLGVRLIMWRGVETTLASASVITEIVLTLMVSYLFAVLGFLLLAGTDAPLQDYRGVWFTLLLSLPVPLALVLLLRHGSVFERLETVIFKLSGLRIPAGGAAQLDRAVRSMLHKRATLIAAGALEFMALLSGFFEIWFAMRLFGRPVSVAAAVILESTAVALRHVAFVVPAGIGVQEAGLVAFGRILGIEGEFALAVSMVKRARELLWGIPSLLSWQWLESRRLGRVYPT